MRIIGNDSGTDVSPCYHLEFGLNVFMAYLEESGNVEQEGEEENEETHSANMFDGERPSKLHGVADGQIPF